MTHNFGTTTNFKVDTTDSFWNGLSATQQTDVAANAGALLGNVEAAFTTTTGWFGTDTSKFGTSHRQEVVFDQADNSGAFNNGYGNAIHVDTQSNNGTIGTAGPIVSMLWMAEWVEVLMSLTSVWNAGDSSGEGLSHYCALQLFLNGHNDYYNAGGNQIFVQNWLNGDGQTNPGTAPPNSARSDWVNHTFTGAKVGGVQVNGDGDPVSYGCALAFIYYLTVELGFSINEVIAQYSSNLASCYHSVTGDQSDPFPAFTGILNHVFPSGQTATLTGANPDNPFPIAQVEFYAQKNTFGKDETQDIIAHQGGLISSAFWVVIDGLSRQAFQNLGITVAPFTGAFASLPGVTISANPAGAEFQNGVHPKAPQRIRIPFDLTLSQPIMMHFPGSGVSPEMDLTTSLITAGQTVSGSSATMDFELIAAGDPYFANIDPTQNNQAYLSQDLRVFGAAPAITGTPFPGGPAFSNDSVAGAYSYVQALLAHLNGTPAFTNPAGTDPFSLLPDQQGEGQTDTSVAPFSLKTSFPPQFVNNYNFAIARVRLRGSSGAAGAAADVRVFFRVFASQSPDTDYDPNGTYASQLDAANHPGSPQPGGGQTTLPFFATGNLGSQTDYQAGGPNIHTLTIPSGQDDLWWYFGCFLNFYDPNNTVAGQQVQTWLPGTHHCVVAQIAYDDAPIPNGVTATSWDQLAQRNLQFTVVDNPGPAATHRAPQTFDVRPSKAIGTPGGVGLPPDELMIDWGAVPQGSTASVFWPAVSAAEVITLAKTWGGAAGLSSSEAHTLTLKIEGGVSYLPIPAGAGQNFAGLLTLELPLGIRAGQEFEVLVRRIATRVGKRVQPPPELRSPPSRKLDKREKSAAALTALAVVERPTLWRYVVGSFVVRIPVSTGERMRIPEEMTLAIMKWRLANLSPGNRWAPVLDRYIKYSSARLDGIGGDSSQVPASLTWTPPLPGEHGRPHPHERELELCGKVTEVLFDCHGEFEGFMLDECCRQRLVPSRERGVAELVLRACRENLTVCVRLCSETDRIERLTLGA
ncbi:MAG: hypothetical protein M3Y42_00500 [Actinomycetota bacterium]|nr:hypothetical protein [Actinomycetota bacterium]MDQ2955432.1 hypothetical protein [Actinomycetota bacterium]